MRRTYELIFQAVSEFRNYYSSGVPMNLMKKPAGKRTCY